MVSHRHSLQLDDSAGAVAILRAAVRLLPRLPSVVVLVYLLSNGPGDFAAVVGQAPP